MSDSALTDATNAAGPVISPPRGPYARGGPVSMPPACARRERGICRAPPHAATSTAGPVISPPRGPYARGGPVSMPPACARGRAGDHVGRSAISRGALSTSRAKCMSAEPDISPRADGGSNDELTGPRRKKTRERRKDSESAPASCGRCGRRIPRTTYRRWRRTSGPGSRPSCRAVYWLPAETGGHRVQPEVHARVDRETQRVECAPRRHLAPRARRRRAEPEPGSPCSPTGTCGSSRTDQTAAGSPAPEAPGPPPGSRASSRVLRCSARRGSCGRSRTRGARPRRIRRTSAPPSARHWNPARSA